eukprot:GEMP01063087.1.p1 GENE.GEMP01063087.1~~GEMP01063087.1.p1  ORF type:complete len:309 (+),score=55.71 GEMP01063087.1:148-1074(+)
MFSDTATSTPFPRRTDLMSLDTIKPSDLDGVSGTLMNTSTIQSARAPLSEVEGSKPLPSWKKYLRGGVSRDPVEGSTPRTHYPPVNRVVDFSIRTRDIECATGKRSLQFQSGRRSVNPVAPTYKLASSIPLPAEVPKLQTPSNFIADIEGTSSKPSVLQIARRETYSLKTCDIPFATPRLRRRHVTRLPEPTLERVARSRDTNPLNPEYKVSLRPPGTLLAKWSEDKQPEQFEPITIGPIQGNMPRALPKSKNTPLFSLENRDILGATPRSWIGCLPAENVKTRDILSVADIPGCQADSRRLSHRRKK